MSVRSNRVFLALMAAFWVPLAWAHACCVTTPLGELAMQPFPNAAPGWAADVDVGFLGVSALWLLLRRVVGGAEAVTPRLVLGAAATLAFLAWLTPNGNSADMFQYIAWGRLVVLQHLSPYYHTCREAQDFYSVRYAFARSTMPYGPLNLPIFTLAGWVSTVKSPMWLYGISAASNLAVSTMIRYVGVLLGLYCIKATGAVLHVATVAVLMRTLPPRNDYRELLLLYAVNPFLLFELVTNGHNDALLVFAAAVCLYAVRRRHPALAAGAALAAGLSKVPGLTLWLALIVYAVHRRDRRRLAVTLGAGVVAVLLLRGVLFDSLADFHRLLPDLNGPSGGPSPCIAGYLFPVLSSVPGLWVTLYWLGVRPLAALGGVLALWGSRSPSRLAWGQVQVWGLLIILILSWQETWYFTWLMPAALLAGAAAFDFSLMLAVSADVVAYYPDRTPLVLGAVLMGIVLMLRRHRSWQTGLTAAACLGWTGLYLMGWHAGLSLFLATQGMPLLWVLGVSRGGRIARSPNSMSGVNDGGYH